MMRGYNYLHSLVCMGLACLFACLMTQQAQAITIQVDADTNIEEHQPGDMEGALTRMQVRARDASGSGRQNASYVRFDLGGGTASGATFSLVNTNNTNWLLGQMQVYGLNNVAGNTPQNWDEATLSFNSSGAEIPGDGNPETQDFGSIGTSGAENLWLLGDLPENLMGGGQTIAFSSSELDNFLNSRGGGLATLLLVGANGTDREVLFATKETGAGTLGATLSGIVPVPEPASMALALFGFITIACAGRRRR